MPVPYDASIKELFERGPNDWLALAGILARGPISALGTDLTSVAAEADRVLLVEEDPKWIVNFEIQSKYDATLPRRLFRYNSMLDMKYGFPVESIAVLLRPEADGPELTGRLTRARPGGVTEMTMAYGIIRIWTLPWEELLRGGLATLPLALIANAPASKLDFIARRVDERLRAEASVPEAQILRTATALLLGLRYPHSEMAKMFGSGEWVKDSSFFQMVYDMASEKAATEGKLGEARGLLLRLGHKRLGNPDESTRARIATTDDLARLELMLERLFDAKTWAEVVAD